MKKLIFFFLIFPFSQLHANYKVYTCKFLSVTHRINHNLQPLKLENKKSFLMYYNNRTQWFYNKAKEEIPNIKKWYKENRYNFKKNDNDIISTLRQIQSNLELNLNSKKKNIPQYIDYNTDYKFNLANNTILLTHNTIFKYEYYEKLFFTEYKGFCSLRK